MQEAQGSRLVRWRKRRREGPPQGKGVDREGDKRVTPLPELPTTPRRRRWACLSCAVDAQTTPRPRGEPPPHPGPQTGRGRNAPEGALLPFTPKVPGGGRRGR